MHKVYENDDLMMYFKKRYCHCCGEVLHKKRTERIVRKSDPDHSYYCHIGTTYKPHGDILVVGKEYFCSSCNKVFSCDEQSEITDAQKHYKKYIVTTEEINIVKNKNIETARKCILKMRWLLLIPIIGVILCDFKIFNGCLRTQTKPKDSPRIVLSTIIFILVAIAVKLVLSLINIEILNAYSRIIMAILGSLAANIPTLILINTRFKKK